MGATPKKRISKTRRDKRRTHHVIALANLVKCENCGEMRRPHRVCDVCGTYRGRQVMPATED